MAERAATWRDELAAVGVLAVATVVVGLPWSVTWRGVMIPRDTAFTVVQVEHLRAAAVGARSLADGPLGWPLQGSLAQADWVAGQALLGWPLAWLDPHLVHNAVVLAGWFLTAWVCHKAAQALLGPGAHTWVAGLIGGLGTVQLAHAQHLNLVHHELAVAAPLVLGVGLLRDRVGWAAAGGALAALGFHLGVYVGLHGLVATAIVAVAGGFARPSWRTWGAAALGLILAGLTVLPVVWIYGGYAARYAVDLDPGELARESWDLTTTLAPVQGVLAHRPLEMIWPSPGGGRALHFTPANPGYVAVGLAVLGGFGLWRRAQPRWAWAAVGAVLVVAALLALGPTLVAGGPTGVPGPYRLVGWLPGLSGLRGADRFLAVVAIAVGLYAAAGVRWLAGRWRWAALLALAPLLEARCTPTDGLELLEIHPVYAALAGLDRPGAVFDEALSTGVRCGCKHHEALRAALWHGRPVVGGDYARRPEALADLNRIALTWPDPEAVTLFDALGVAATVEHEVHGVPPASSRCTTTERHRACLLEAGAPFLTELHWASPPSRVVVTCGGEAREVSVAPWAALTRARYGSAGPALEVWSRCAAPEADGAEVVAHGAKWPPSVATREIGGRRPPIRRGPERR